MIAGGQLTFGEAARSSADQTGHGWVPIPLSVLPPEELIPHDARASFISRMRPQPAATFTEPLHLTGAADRLRRGFIRCTLSSLDVGGDPIAPSAAFARAQGWPYRELRAPHDPQLFDPDETAAALSELAASVGFD